VTQVRQRPVVAYFVLAYVFSWSYWLADAAAGGHWSHFPGLLGPALAAVVVSTVLGVGELQRLGRDVLRWRLAPRWYGAAAVPLAVAACVLAISGWPSLHALAVMKGAPEIGWVGVFLFVLLVNGFGEETGWRGFAWMKLRERYELRSAALRLGALWALWHLPTFFVDSGFKGLSPLILPGLFFSMTCGAVVLGWLYERTHSVLLVALWHSALNMASATDGTEKVAPFVSAAVIVWAVCLLRQEARYRATRSATSPIISASA
jgi:membrane protease YdiL (CAAX protease family)